MDNKILLMVAAALALVSPTVRAGDEASWGKAGWNKFFTFESDDGDYKLQVKGRLQVRYAFVDRESNATTVNADDMFGSFMVRRAYITFTGNAFTKDLTYDITLNGQGAAGNVLEYGWMNYKVMDPFQVRAGLFKVPFNRQEMTSSGKQQFVDRSLANERFNLDRSIGIVLHGMALEKKIEWYLSMFNGRQTRTGLNVSSEMGYTARVVWNALGYYDYKESAVDNKDETDLTVGVAGAFYHEEPTVSATEERVIMGNADIGFKHGRWSAQAEGFFRNTSVGAAGTSVNDAGFYAQGGYFFVPERFEIAARAAMLFDDLGDNGGGSVFNNGSLTNLGGLFDGVDEGSDTANEQEYSLVFNYYIKNTAIKLQAQYTCMMDGIAGRDDIMNHIGMVQAQLEF